MSNLHLNKGVFKANDDLQAVKKELDACPSDQFEQLQDLSKSAVNIAYECYDQLLKNEHANRMMLEVLRININAFGLTLEKLARLGPEKGDDYKQIVASFIQTFTVLLFSSQKTYNEVEKSA
jgi:hypothetical protein